MSDSSVQPAYMVVFRAFRVVFRVQSVVQSLQSGVQSLYGVQSLHRGGGAQSLHGGGGAQSLLDVQIVHLGHRTTLCTSAAFRVKLIGPGAFTLVSRGVNCAGRTYSQRPGPGRTSTMFLKYTFY